MTVPQPILEMQAEHFRLSRLKAGIQNRLTQLERQIALAEAEADKAAAQADPAPEAGGQK